MIKTRIFILLMTIGVFGFGQLNTFSPYSNYGIGKMDKNIFANNFAMGGLAIGVIDSNHVNPSNPASYSFLNYTHAEFGVKMSLVNYSNSLGTNREVNGHLSHFTIGFPMGKKKNFGFGAGLVPLSSVGFRVANTGNNYETASTGSGGLNNAFTGLAYRYKNISLGLNMNYVFGNIVKESVILFDDPMSLSHFHSENDKVKGFLLDYGLQYKSNPIGDNMFIGVGAYYKTGQNLNISRRLTSFDFLISVPEDSLSLEEMDLEGVTSLPSTLGIGIVLSKSSKWMVGVDYELSDWTNFSYFGDVYSLYKESTYRLGYQYVINPMARNKGITKGNTWKDGLLYRGGLRYTNSYIGDASMQLTEFGISFGVDVMTPFNINFEVPSFWTLALEYGSFGTSDGVWTSEKFFKLNFAYTFSDVWFKKSRIN